MKTIPALLQAHYDAGTTTLATVWKITRRDGPVFGFTDHDQPIVIDGLAYEVSSAFDASAVATRGELNADNLELVGLLDSAGITRESLEAGLWDGAAVVFSRVNWQDLSQGAEILRSGELGQVKRRGGGYVAEIRGLMARLQSNIGRVITPTCGALLGDARCQVDLAPLTVAATITAVNSRREFVASSLGQPDGHFDGGEVFFTSGANTGLRTEVRDFAAGVVELFLRLPFAATVGDGFEIHPGCDKRKETCIGVYDNVVNFRGFSFVPGLDQTNLIGGQ